MSSGIVSRHMEALLDRLSPGGFSAIEAYAAARQVPAVERAVGELMATLAHIRKPCSIIDIGCGIGNSTRFLALAAPDATVVGVDANRERIEAAQNFCADIPRVRFVQSMAEEYLRQTDETFDFVFVDSIKRDYALIWHYVKKRLAKPAVIVFDDVLMYGYTACERAEIPRKYRAMCAELGNFLREIKRDHPHTSQLIPMGNGVLVVSVE